MAFTFIPIKGTDYLRDVYPKLNKLGSDSVQTSKDVDGLKSQLSQVQTYSLTDNFGRNKENVSIDLSNANSFTDVYGTLVDPPSGESDKGWLTLKSTPTGNAIVTFFPDNSEKMYKRTKSDGSWSDWVLYLSAKDINKFVPTDILNNGEVDYSWSRDAQTLEQEVDKLPQGFFTFYANQHMPSSQFEEPVRGTILKDIFTEGYYAIVKCIGYSGKEYVIPIVNGESKLKQQTLMTVDLWNGTQDLASKVTKPLNDDVSNYDYLEFYVEFSLGGAKTIKVPSRLTTVYFRDLNLANNDSSSGFDLYEGAVSISGKSFTPYLSKKVTSTNRIDYNTSGTIILKSIVGIKQI